MNIETITDKLDQIGLGDSTNIQYNEKQPHQLYLLVILMIVFIALFFLAYNSLKKLKVSLKKDDDAKFKIVNGLILANGILE